MDDDTVERLAHDILRCTVVAETLVGAHTPCRAVVGWQGSRLSPRYCPEPWVGHLGTAPVLFISSNPGADEQGAAPKPDWSLSNECSDEELFRAADSAFEAGQLPGICAGKYLVDRHGVRHGRAIRYWIWAKRTGRELLGRDAIPGTDYALSEVVHCGTKREQGVAEARPLCTRRYLKRLLVLSPASIVIVIGAHARASFQEELGITIAVGEFWGPSELLGRPRCIVGLPHPNQRGVRWGLSAALGDAATERVVAFMRGAA
jgi:hypothetical protein